MDVASCSEKKNAIRHGFEKDQIYTDLHGLKIGFSEVGGFVLRPGDNCVNFSIKHILWSASEVIQKSEISEQKSEERSLFLPSDLRTLASDLHKCSTGSACGF